MRIIQDFKNWRDAKKIADVAESEFDMHVQQSFEHCHAYPCVYTIHCNNKKMGHIQRHEFVYETFCNGCSAFNVLKKKYESQKAKRKLLSNFIFWKTK